MGYRIESQQQRTQYWCDAVSKSADYIKISQCGFGGTVTNRLHIIVNQGTTSHNIDVCLRETRCRVRIWSIESSVIVRSVSILTRTHVKIRTQLKPSKVASFTSLTTSSIELMGVTFFSVFGRTPSPQPLVRDPRPATSLWTPISWKCSSQRLRNFWTIWALCNWLRSVEFDFRSSIELMIIPDCP